MEDDRIDLISNFIYIEVIIINYYENSFLPATILFRFIWGLRLRKFLVK